MDCQNVVQMFLLAKQLLPVSAHEGQILPRLLSHEETILLNSVCLFSAVTASFFFSFPDSSVL